MLDFTRRHKSGWILFCLLVEVGDLCLGYLTFTTYPQPSNGTCEGNDIVLIWDYDTDETVVTIEWYKQPGATPIADLFGTTFTPKGTYATRVTRFDTSKYKAAIKLTGFTSADGGQYSCTVTANTARVQTGEVEYKEAPAGPAVVDSSDPENTKCSPPPGTTGVKLTWSWLPSGSSGMVTRIETDLLSGLNTCSGGNYSCCMTGGAADCGSSSYCANGTIKDWLLILISLIFLIPDLIFSVIYFIREIWCKNLQCDDPCQCCCSACLKPCKKCFSCHDARMGCLWVVIIVCHVIGYILTGVLTALLCKDDLTESLIGIAIGIPTAGTSFGIKMWVLCSKRFGKGCQRYKQDEKHQECVGRCKTILCCACCSNLSKVLCCKNEVAATPDPKKKGKPVSPTDVKPRKLPPLIEQKGKRKEQTDKPKEQEEKSKKQIKNPEEQNKNPEEHAVKSKEQTQKTKKPSGIAKEQKHKEQAVNFEEQTEELKQQKQNPKQQNERPGEQTEKLKEQTEKSTEQTEKPKDQNEQDLKKSKKKKGKGKKKKSVTKGDQGPSEIQSQEQLTLTRPLSPIKSQQVK